jgi:quercetin dioxygenase-like cupin family protein
MPYFFDPKTRTGKELAPGVVARTFWGDRVLVALVDLAPGAVVPPHSHPHEQVTTLLRGNLEITAGGETRSCKPGDVCVFPGGTEHGVVNGAEPARVIDTFAPVREEYKFPD